MEKQEIREVTIEKYDDGRIKRAYILFGPHYFVDIMPNESGELTLHLGATHHGFHARATEVGGELEKIIDEIKQLHPDQGF